MLQLGGAVVADSDPAAEWAETVVKGRDIAAVLQKAGRADHLLDLERLEADLAPDLMVDGDKSKDRRGSGVL